MCEPTSAFLNILVKRITDKEVDIGEDIKNRSLDVVIVAASRSPYFQELYNSNQTRNIILVIPCGTEKITKSAFDSCNRIKRVFVPSSVVEIEEAAFVNCTQLTEVLFETGSNLNVIGNKAFLGCLRLTGILNDGKLEQMYKYKIQNRDNTCILPKKLTTIGYGAFSNCDFNEILFPDSLTKIGNGSLSNCAALETINVPKIMIGERAFMYCSGLNKVRFSNGVSKISNGMFAGCRSLSDITFPDTLEQIEIGAFSTCTALKEVRFSEASTLHTIQDNGFIFCDLLKTVVLPMSLETLGLRAFHGCDSLREVYCSMKIFDRYLFIISDIRPDGNEALYWHGTPRTEKTQYHIHDQKKIITVQTMQ